MKTLALISAIIISGMLLLANYQRGENKSNIKDNNFIDAMWEEPTPLYGNQYFTLENKYQPGAYKELGHSISSTIKIAFDPAGDKGSIEYTAADKTYSIDRYFLRYCE